MKFVDLKEYDLERFEAEKRTEEKRKKIKKQNNILITINSRYTTWQIKL